MNFDATLEERIKQEALTLLQSGRPNWDIPHTLGSVVWMKKLLGSEGGDEKILVTAMYFHDTGYPQLSNGYGYEECKQAKKSHAELGATHARKVLETIGGFTNEEIERVAYLIEHHDQHDNITDHDRQLVFEADGLAQIDVELVPPSFDQQNFESWMNEYFQLERPFARWKTETGKKNYLVLLEKANNYWK